MQFSKFGAYSETGCGCLKSAECDYLAEAFRIDFAVEELHSRLPAALCLSAACARGLRPFPERNRIYPDSRAKSVRLAGA